MYALQAAHLYCLLVSGVKGVSNKAGCMDLGVQVVVVKGLLKDRWEADVVVFYLWFILLSQILSFGIMHSQVWRVGGGQKRWIDTGLKEVIERHFCGFAFMSSTPLHLYTHRKLFPSLLSWVHSCLMYILVHLGRVGELMPRERPKRKAFCKWKFVTIRGVLCRREVWWEGKAIIWRGWSEFWWGGGSSFQKGIDRSLQLLSLLHSPHQPQF